MQEAGEDDCLRPFESCYLYGHCVYIGGKEGADFQNVSSQNVSEAILWNWSSFCLSIPAACGEISR